MKMPSRPSRQRQSIASIEFLPVVTHAIKQHAVSVVHVLRGASASPDPRPDLTISLPRVPKCAHKPGLTCFVFDESGSVTAHNDPTRPIAARHREAALAIDRLGTCRCGNEMAAIGFFDAGPSDTGACALTRAGRRMLHSAIDNPPPYTSSELESALIAAEDLASQYPNHHASIVVLSDFLLYDADPANVLRRFAAFPGDRHAVVLNTKPPTQLTDDDGITVTRISWNSEAGAVARALLPALAARR